MKTTLRRLEALEKANGYVGRLHMVFGMDSDEMEQRRVGLLSSDEWREGDSVIAVCWLSLAA